MEDKKYAEKENHSKLPSANESGKRGRVTATIYGSCLNSGGIQTNAKVGKQLSPSQKAFTGTLLRYFPQMMVTQKEKLRQMQHRFDRSVMEAYSST